MSTTVAPTPQVGVKIYKGNKGVITFYGDTIKKCNFDLFPFLKIFGKGNKLYLNQLEGAPKGARQYPFQSNNTIQFGGKQLCDSMKKYEGKFYLLHDDGEHSYYLDTEISKIGDKPNANAKRSVQIQPDCKTFAEQVNALYENPVKDKPEPKKPMNTAESFVINTLRALSDECIDNDDLAGAKALLKAIRKFTEMK